MWATQVPTPAESSGMHWESKVENPDETCQVQNLSGCDSNHRKCTTSVQGAWNINDMENMVNNGKRM